jgi:hypothetical protein
MQLALRDGSGALPRGAFVTSRGTGATMPISSTASKATFLKKGSYWRCFNSADFVQHDSVFWTWRNPRSKAR